MDMKKMDLNVVCWVMRKNKEGMKGGVVVEAWASFSWRL
jgi:hypothetical protein